MTAWPDRARALAADLADRGVLTPDWRPAFEAVPRHVFVPTALTGDGSPRADVADVVYRDETLTTQVAHVAGTGAVVPTSSSTRPGLMARMLGMSDAAPGHTVLEIGTGTGYNAALLCHRLGSAAVTSIDIDPALVDVARGRLAALGFTPALVAGDGAGGVPARAPFDRILATCSVSAVPAAWVRQLRENGRVVADVSTATSSTLISATRDGGGDLVGRFHPVPGYFMRLRPRADDPYRTPGEGATTFDRTRVRPGPALDPALIDDPDAGFQIAVRLPHVTGRFGTLGRGSRELRAEDGSWVRVELDHSASQGGPRSLADEVAAVVRAWASRGHPARDRHGFTVTPHGTTTVWLDSPDRPLDVVDP